MSAPKANIRPGWKRAGWAALHWAKRHEPEIDAALFALRRARVIARLKLLAAWNGSSIDIDIASDVRFGRRIDITIWPHTQNAIRIGPGTSIADYTMITLNNGTLVLGDGMDVRRGVIFMCWGGTLEFAGDNVLSWGSAFHCAASIRIGRLTCFGEYSTVVDSTHTFTEPDTPFAHQTKTGPVEIGYNTWVASKAVIGRNSKVGDHCIIAGNAVVTGEVPSAHLAAGVGAPQLRPLAHPWLPAPARATPARAATAAKTAKPRRVAKRPPAPKAAAPDAAAEPADPGSGPGDAGPRGV